MHLDPFLFHYFPSQVLKLFEQFDAPDYVIRVAHIALDLAAPDDPNIVSVACFGGLICYQIGYGLKIVRLGSAATRKGVDRNRGTPK